MASSNSPGLTGSDTSTARRDSLSMETLEPYVPGPGHKLSTPSVLSSSTDPLQLHREPARHLEQRNFKANKTRNNILNFDEMYSSKNFVRFYTVKSTKDSDLTQIKYV